MAITTISGKPHCCTVLHFHMQLAADVLGSFILKISLSQSLQSCRNWWISVAFCKLQFPRLCSDNSGENVSLLVVCLTEYSLRYGAGGGWVGGWNNMDLIV